GPLPARAADDPVPAEIPALVVRLEPGTSAVQQPNRHLPVTHGRHLSLDRRAAGPSPRLSLPRRGERAQPRHAAGEVAPRNPPLPPPFLPPRGRLLLRLIRLVRVSPPRGVPAGGVKLRGGGPPREQGGVRVPLPPGHRQVPAVPARPLSEAAVS